MCVIIPYPYIFVSESDIFGPIDYLCDIENLVSLQRAMYEDYSFDYRTTIFLLFMSKSPLWSKYIESIMNGVHDKYKGDTFLSNTFGVNLMRYLRYDIYIAFKEFCYWKIFFYSFCGPVKFLSRTII